MRVALYARVSTTDQHTENQLEELRRYAVARNWQTFAEYVDRGVSGAKESRPALDGLMKDAKRRRFDAVLVWRLDRLGRSLSHLVRVLDELQSLGVAFVSLAESLDATTAAGKLMTHLLAAFAEFERGRIQERVRAGLARVRAQGKTLGRPTRDGALSDLERVRHLSTRKAAPLLGVSAATIARLRAKHA
jgi:DNA invertase Pin-like site-specific DNA recombinase